DVGRTIIFNTHENLYHSADPPAYLSSVVHGEIKVKPTDLSSLGNNLVVMEILDAAKRSASSDTTIFLK
ncbi:MAG: hypothetical protein ACLFT3_17400, partial [Cyclobacteriaceae bacterium]